MRGVDSGQRKEEVAMASTHRGRRVGGQKKRAHELESTKKEKFGMRRKRASVF